ncbi:receptor-type tyrosine-protein phosphatase kappa-like isoform X2 [Pomacea canaliculata]|uniref:receptor-type tyrosine-protein phosphatase kappa-like isoform X2 n=1 Tax=Pomacea canaliculata TaxID=400727 RepID=UPI000D734233|nr:receptor-type tyrosine-protein phosphatase kappa-like isoform X2 [Pomacea canaliculata]
MAGCVLMWTVTLCVFVDAQLGQMINIAFNKACSISSRYAENGKSSGDCSAAINGNTDTNFDLWARPPNCIHTATNDHNPLWWVDLGRNFSLHSIIIYGRRNNIQRMNCVEVSLDGEHVYTFSCTGTVDVTTVIDLSPPRHGRVVTITRNYTTPGDYSPFLNICEVQIWVCKVGWWGSDCQTQCSQTCQHAGDDTREDNYCDSDNGACVKGCVPGSWGENCTHTCGVGCGDGCSASYYNMSNDCHNTCDEGCNNTCSRTDGACQCRRGWQLPLCQQCSDGYYNESNDCQNTCGGGCHDTCNKTDGTCQCRQGWQPPLCQHCMEGHYSESNDCQNTCGGGCNDTCSRTDGTCLCQSGWQPPLCQLEMKSDSNSLSVGVIAGPVVAVVVASVVVVIIVMWLRSRRQHKGSQPERSRHHYTSSWNNQQELSMSNPGNEAAYEGISAANAKQGSKPTVAVKPQTHTTPVDKVGDIHINHNLSEEQSHDSQYVLNTIYSEYSGNGNTSGAVTNTDNLANGSRAKGQVTGPGTTQGPVVQNKNAEKNIYENVKMKTNSLTKSKDRQSKPPRTKSDDDITNATDDEGEDIYNTEDIYASYRSLEPSSILDDFQKSLLASLVSGRLGTEFAEFSKEMQHPHEVASMPENSKKNRFKALCAYDHSRVVLHRPKGDKNTDYINANYIKGCLKEKGYIATQGPRANTIADLWWMVWQENTKQIIMLSNLIEGGKNKCEEYWPQVGTKKTYGHVTVTALKVDTRADFIIRYFSLETKKGGEQRTVSQYHYLVWPDHGVPSTLSLVNFWRYVRTRAQGGIPVVHCSAGVGRTGTYIALDIASDLRSRGRDVNVKEIVSRLREDRTLMVQTEAQYKFLHEAILEEHTSRTSRMTFDQFDNAFPDTINIYRESRVDKEFKMLNQMGEFVAKPKYGLAASKENIHKNRSKESLPDDDHLEYLTDYVPGRNQYINAVHMSSFRKSQGLILTQLPLPYTVVDLWRLVDGRDVKTIVSLGHKDQSQFVENYCRYWPGTDKDTLKAGPYSISLTSSSALGDHLTCYNLSLTTKASKDKTVRVLYYEDWADLVPGRVSDILQLTDILESWHVEEDSSPIVVQCSDGMTRSGMFCALYDVINRARYDQEIDVYLPVRQVRTVRQQAITSQVQYRYCYQAAQECKRQHSIYQNT